MSATLYCPKCGTKNDSINGKQANFCSSCGTNLQSLAHFGLTPTPKPTARPAGRSGVTTPVVDISFSDEVEEGQEEIGFSKDDVVIEKSESNVVPMKNILGTASQGYDGARQSLNTKGKKKSGKATIASFKQEAGAGPTKRIEIG